MTQVTYDWRMESASLFKQHVTQQKYAVCLQNMIGIRIFMSQMAGKPQEHTKSESKFLVMASPST